MLSDSAVQLGFPLLGAMLLPPLIDSIYFLSIARYYPCTYLPIPLLGTITGILLLLLLQHPLLPSHSTLPIPAGTCTALPSTYPLYCLSPARSTTNTIVPPPAATQGTEVEMEYTSRKNGDCYFTSNYF